MDWVKSDLCSLLWCWFLRCQRRLLMKSLCHKVYGTLFLIFCVVFLNFLVLVLLLRLLYGDDSKTKIDNSLIVSAAKISDSVSTICSWKFKYSSQYSNRYFAKILGSGGSDLSHCNSNSVWICTTSSAWSLFETSCKLRLENVPGLHVSSFFV